MKYLKYILVSLLCGFFFTLGAMLVLIYVMPQLSEYDIDAHNKERIAEIESRNGISCSQLYSDTLEFSLSEIGELIRLGLEGHDWVAAITIEQKAYIEGSKEKLYDCQLLEYQAKHLEESWPDFSELTDLFQALDTFSTRYGTGPATAKHLKPHAFERVQFLYQNVTSQAKRTPHSGASS